MKASIKNTFAALVLPACAALALLGTTTTSDAAAYLKIGDIKGEATDADHKEWIVLESISHSIARPIVSDAGGGSTATRRRGDVILGDITCVKALDKASPKIAESLCNGTHFPEVELFLTVSVPYVDSDGTVKNKQEPYLKYKLTDCIITSYSFQGMASGDPLPSESITLSYTKIEWSYIEKGKEGAPDVTHVGTCEDSTPAGE